ncbi:putative transcription factor C2H2 family [Rosa chinensis]|uniref:RBR-type E3 ubiquitin transferase n=1 Tax=Rosa chinensis TaxID=74649 RepID=A0A2P6RL27_ROSCH|nr:E3 ubiquitin-protein ligase RNF144A isoform X2 [Rosa chinensis]PRQ47101.1 putative transcription factor C2H2 family [Rosa chinensis]
MLTSKPSHSHSHSHSPIQILTVDDDDDDDAGADVIFPPIPHSSSSAAIAVHDDRKDPSAPRSSPSPTKVPTFIDLSDEPDDGDDDEIRILRFKPTKTHFKKRRTNPFTSGSVSEPGQSSSDSLTDYPPFVCAICADDKPGYQSFPIENCNHVYCSDCVINYIDFKLQENEPTIRCPVPGCKGLLEPEYCRSVLPAQVFARWGKAMCDAVIQGSEKFYCPYQDCSALLIDDGEEVVRESQCPHCGRMFCAQCKVAWHVGMDCSEFQRLSVDERGNEDVMLRNLAQSQNWRRCPSCMFYVEKSVGCSYMRCRCGYAFCYNCGVQAVSHTCRSCHK